MPRNRRFLCLPRESLLLKQFVTGVWTFHGTHVRSLGTRELPQGTLQQDHIVRPSRPRIGEEERQVNTARGLRLRCRWCSRHLRKAPALCSLRLSSAGLGMPLSWAQSNRLWTFCVRFLISNLHRETLYAEVGLLLRKKNESDPGMSRYGEQFDGNIYQVKMLWLKKKC